MDRALACDARGLGSIPASAKSLPKKVFILSWSKLARSHLSRMMKQFQLSIEQKYKLRSMPSMIMYGSKKRNCVRKT